MIANLVGLLAVSLIHSATPAVRDSGVEPIDRPYPKVVLFKHCLTPGQAVDIRVKVGFEVSPEGQPEIISIIHTDDGCFNEAAIEAVSRWRYAPLVVDGQRARRYGMSSTVVFKINYTTDDAV